MATRKITQLTELAATPHDDDEFIIVDVSDTTMSPEGTNKRIKASNLPTGGGGGSDTFSVSFSGRANLYATSRYYYGNSAYGWNYVAWSAYAATFTAVGYMNCHNGIAIPAAYTTIKIFGVLKNSISGNDVRLTCWRTANPNGAAVNPTTTSLVTQTITATTNNVHYQIGAQAAGITVSANDLLFFTVDRTTGASATNNADFSVTIQLS